MVSVFLFRHIRDVNPHKSAFSFFCTYKLFNVCKDQGWLIMSIYTQSVKTVSAGRGVKINEKEIIRDFSAWAWEFYSFNRELSLWMKSAEWAQLTFWLSLNSKSEPALQQDVSFLQQHVRMSAVIPVHAYCIVHLVKFSIHCLSSPLEIPRAKRSSTITSNPRWLLQAWTST